MRRKWGRWASRTRLFLYAIPTTSDNTELEPTLVTSEGIQEGVEGEDCDDEERASAPQKATSKAQFLEKDSGGLWALGPLPARGSVRSADLGTSLHTYVTQQWSMVVSYPC